MNLQVTILLLTILLFSGCTIRENACEVAQHWHEREALRIAMYQPNATLQQWHEERATAFWHAQLEIDAPSCDYWMAYRYYPGTSIPSPGEQ